MGFCSTHVAPSPKSQAQVVGSPNDQSVNVTSVERRRDQAAKPLDVLTTDSRGLVAEVGGVNRAWLAFVIDKPWGVCYNGLGKLRTEADMQSVSRSIQRLFGSLPGLLVVVVAWEALIVASLAPLIDAVLCLCESIPVQVARPGEGLDGALFRDGHCPDLAGAGPVRRRAPGGEKWQTSLTFPTSLAMEFSDSFFFEER